MLAGKFAARVSRAAWLSGWPSGASTQLLITQPAPAGRFQPDWGPDKGDDVAAGDAERAVAQRPFVAPVPLPEPGGFDDVHDRLP